MPKIHEDEVVVPTRDGTRHTHPSYGTISISRGHGAHHLFGSSIPDHDSVIYLRISQATRNVSTLGSEFVHAKAPDIEVAMSPAQFAQFVTSVGLGDGTPCTITAFHGQQVASCPSQTPRHVLAEAGINSDIARRINALKPRLETIEKTIDDTKMTQKAAAKLRGQVRGLVRNLTSDLEFAQVTLQEAGADYLQEVEIAAEAAVGDLLRRAGADILASRVDTPRALTEGDETCT